MTTVKTVRNPHSVQKAAGIRITANHRDVLDMVCSRLHDKGVEVLGTLFARTPGFLTFYAIAFRSDQITDKSPAPLGCVRISFLRNGQVNVTLMGLTREGRESVSNITTWIG